MLGLQRIPVQVALVIALFAGSVLLLLVNVFSSLSLPRREPELRSLLQRASTALADAAASSADQLAGPPSSPRLLDEHLHAISNRVLADFPEVEGGFYLAGTRDRFAGFAFPTRPPTPHPPPSRTDPPPLETPYIRAQARQSLDLAPGESEVQVRDVATSRVLIATGPVGTARPALMTTWVMYRLTRPENLEEKLQRFGISVGLALAGIVVALVLTLNLANLVRRQRREQDRLRDELRKAEHLAGLGRLLAGVAHEVRTPLAGIRSTVQLWQRLPQTASSPESQAAVIQAVDRLNELVSRLLHFARADHSERRPFNINAVISETLSLLAAQAASQGVQIERYLAVDLPDVLGSASGLQQVCLNLATNALQAMPSGGQLRCQTFRGVGGRVEVRVSDTGLGVAPEVQAHLFEPFFTTRPEGTGLGLALCREIIVQHGGEIDVESQPGRGATFHFWLPALSSSEGWSRGK